MLCSVFINQQARSIGDCTHYDTHSKRLNLCKPSTTNLYSPSHNMQALSYPARLDFKPQPPSLSFTKERYKSPTQKTPNHASEFYLYLKELVFYIFKLNTRNYIQTHTCQYK